MTATEEGTSATAEGTAEASARVPPLAVWAVSALSALAGLVLALGGLVLVSVSDRERIAEMVRTGQIQTEWLTDAQAVDMIVSLSWWIGLGFVATGLLLVLAGVGFLAYQRRVGRRRSNVAGLGGATVWTYALLGAFVTILTSFLTVSPLFGGAVAGYLRGGETGSGAKVGGLAGALAAIPLVVLLAFVLAGLVLGMPDVGVVGGRAILAAILALATLFAVALTVVLSGIGGVVGAFLSGDDSATE